MGIDLNEEPPGPEWPEGVQVRTFVPGRDDRDVFEAVEDAFEDVRDRPRGTFERFVGTTKGEHFDPSLWFLATDGGEIAGTVPCKTVDGDGWVDVVCVRRAWRSPGLRLALLRHAFGGYRRRGVHREELSVDAGSATGLYGRAGMRLEVGYAVYRKESRAGAPTRSGQGCGRLSGRLRGC